MAYPDRVAPKTFWRRIWGCPRRCLRCGCYCPLLFWVDCSKGTKPRTGNLLRGGAVRGTGTRRSQFCAAHYRGPSSTSGRRQKINPSRRSRHKRQPLHAPACAHAIFGVAGNLRNTNPHNQGKSAGHERTRNDRSRQHDGGVSLRERSDVQRN